MLKQTTRRIVVGALAGLSACLFPLQAPATEKPLTWQTNEFSVALVQAGKLIWQFQHGTNAASKPFFHPLALPGGAPLTWQSPADHVWHYGLWFSWKYLNGVNYWEENKAGQSAGVTSWRVERIETHPDFSARIELVLDYRARGAAKPTLTEQRVITVSPPAADGSYALDWKLKFTAGDDAVKFDRTPLPGEPGGQVYGGYAGLSLRFAKELTEARVAATAAPGEPRENRYRFAATAADYNGRIDGAEAGVAFLDHPANLRHPTRWYAIVNPQQPFSFLNMAWLQLQAFELAAQQDFTLRYRVVVHPGRWDAARLEAEQEKFAASGRARIDGGRRNGISPLAGGDEFEVARSWFPALGLKNEHYPELQCRSQILGDIRGAMSAPNVTAN